MDKNHLIRVLSDWNFWEREPDTGIPRPSYVTRMSSYLQTGQIVVITGARRSGKSYLMRQLVKELIQSGVDRKATLFINFEDPRLPGFKSQTLHSLYEVYREFLNPKQPPVVFLDEVQEVTGWEKWVRMMHELRKARIVVSGSNARLLSRELATVLTGRHLSLTILPLSFREFLSFKGLPIPGSSPIPKDETDLKSLFQQYLEYGGFPEVALQERKTEILLSYLGDVLQRDISQRYRVRKKEALNSLARYYFSNVSHLTTFSSLEKSLDLSADTIATFSGYFEAAYLLFFVKRFAWKVKEQEKSPRKVYAVDTGLANTIGFQFSRNAGAIAENLVFLCLKHRQMNDPNVELYYWKDARGWEVDFVVKEARIVTDLIQVCWQMHSPQTRRRELNSLRKAMQELTVKKALVITEEDESEETTPEGRIRFLPLWKWLLSS